MDAELLERMLRRMALFYGPDKGPLIVFSGSMSQLQPVGSRLRLWQSQRFEELLSSSTPLFVNRRQFKDPGYAEAVTYLQFNMVKDESQRIFRSQASACEADMMNPEYESDKLRIFHQDEQLMTYTAAYMNKARSNKKFGEKFLSVVQNRAYSKEPKAWYEVLKQASQTLPKLFSMPRNRAGARPTERDYLKVDSLWVGCKVRMIWHMDFNGIQVAKTQTVSLLNSNMQTDMRQAHTIRDTEGIVQSIRFKRESQFIEFYVTGIQTGTLYKVMPSK